MKKLLFFFLMSICALPAVKAQTYGYDDVPDNRGALRVRVSDNSPITIELDNRRFKRSGSSLLVGDLPKGRHYLKIYQFDGYNRHRAQLIYDGVVRVRKHTLTNAVLDVNTGNLDENTEDMADQPMQPGNNNGQGNDNGMPPPNNNDGNNNNGNGYQGDYNNGNTPPPPPYPVIVDRWHPKPQPKYYPPVPGDYVAITADGISKTEEKVKDKITDTDKLKVLQSSLKKKSFNTDQLALMMSWLSFEQSRLELAKWAYTHTTDKNNFENLERNQFSDGSNRSELDSYINSQNAK